MLKANKYSCSVLPVDSFVEIMAETEDLFNRGLYGTNHIILSVTIATILISLNTTISFAVLKLRIHSIICIFLNRHNDYFIAFRKYCNIVIILSTKYSVIEAACFILDSKIHQNFYYLSMLLCFYKFGYFKAP